MRTIGTLFLGCAMVSLAAAVSLTAAAQSSSSRAAAPSPYVAYSGDKATAIAAPLEISFAYSYMHANQGPGQCNCFTMNGGSTEAAIHAYRWLSGVADLTGERTGSINGGAHGLSLASFTVGPRFTYPIHHRYAPFAQTLVGAAHGFDSYFPVTSGSTSATNGFALMAGGGLDIRFGSYWAIRPIQADYFFTRIPNGVNNRQNNFRLSAGFVLRIW